MICQNPPELKYAREATIMFRERQGPSCTVNWFGKKVVWKDEQNRLFVFYKTKYLSLDVNTGYGTGDYLCEFNKEDVPESEYANSWMNKNNTYSATKPSKPAAIEPPLWTGPET